MSATTSDTSTPELVAVRAALHRLLAPAPDASERARAAAESIGEGGSVAEALARAGVGADVAAALAEAAAPHPAVAIDALVPALARREARKAQLRSAAFYPALVALSTLVVAWLLSVDVVPQLDRVRQVIGGVADPTPVAATLPPVLVSAVLLILFALALAFDLPVLGFRQARQLRERALCLAAIEGFLRAGVALPLAIRASTKVVRDVSTQAAAGAWAAALERGEARPDGLVDGLAAALLSESIKAGTATATLAPLVGNAEAEAASSSRAALRRVQVASLLVAGLGLLLTAVTFMRAYAGAFGVAG